MLIPARVSRSQASRRVPLWTLTARLPCIGYDGPTAANWEVLEPLCNLRRLTLPATAARSEALRQALTQLPWLQHVLYVGLYSGHRYYGLHALRGHRWLAAAAEEEAEEYDSYDENDYDFSDSSEDDSEESYEDDDELEEDCSTEDDCLENDASDEDDQGDAGGDSAGIVGSVGPADGPALDGMRSVSSLS